MLSSDAEVEDRIRGLCAARTITSASRTTPAAMIDRIRQLTSLPYPVGSSS